MVLAIEADGATYHAGETARDRDRLRQDHLERLGWRFHRIWSTDWFHHRDAEIERAVDAWLRAVETVDDDGPPRPPSASAARFGIGRHD
jgi:very-short-patch-repair endonuclease